MKISRIHILALSTALLLGAGFCNEAKAQTEDIIVDYNRPRQYVVGGVSVEGNEYKNADQIIQVSGLYLGTTVTVPGEAISNVVTRLWAQRQFKDVQVKVDSIVPTLDTAFFKIVVSPVPIVLEHNFVGVSKNDRDDLKEKLGIRMRDPYNDHLINTSVEAIKKFYAEKGYLQCTVEPEVKESERVKNTVVINFNINKGPRIRIKDINFIDAADGDNQFENISGFKVARSMKNTHGQKWYNFFNSKKFKENEYPTDKKLLIEAFNEKGYRDARVVSDSIYPIHIVKKNGKVKERLGIDITIDQGNRYYFRDITWTGNSVYGTDALNEVLGIQKGDVYDNVTMEKRIFGGGKQSDLDIRKLYMDNGFLFFNIDPVELTIQNDSVDVEMRISEGKQATLNNIIINGNDLTNEKIVRRQVFTRPGYLFTQSDFERSIREIASLGQFDPEAIADATKGYSILPNQVTNTVDVVYNVTEKPSSQLELSGGWGGNTFVATVGVSFNNFSTQRMFDKSAWRPVPLGDAQNLAFRFQTNGTYYTSMTASFTEPWLFGKKPTSLNLAAYYSRQTNSNLYFGILSNDKQFEVFGASASLGKRLKWPDNYFVFYSGLSWQTYRLKDWISGYFIFDDGISNNVSMSLNLSRTSTDQQIYPRQGSEFSLSLSLTPPYSLLRRKDIDENGNRVKVGSWKDINYNSGNWAAQDRYKWIEYHKWGFSGATYSKLIGDLVLMTKAQFGYLGYYNRNLGYSPFEGYLVGGDGMSGYSSYGQDVIALRGYTNYSLTPYMITPYNSSGYSYAGNMYDKFTVELRYPVLLEPSSTIFILAFLEGGNCWADIRQFNPFQIKRSAGVGARVFLPMVGLLGIDWGYGFDDKSKGGSQFHFVIGQQF